MRYQVFDTDERADTDAPNTSLKKGYGWDNSIFDTFDEAKQYLLKWIEPYGLDDKDIKVNTKHFYYGDKFWMEIKEIE